MRVLGLDYGEKTVGVALSDGLGLTAHDRAEGRKQAAVHLQTD